MMQVQIRKSLAITLDKESIVSRVNRRLIVMVDQTKTPALRLPLNEFTVWPPRRLVLSLRGGLLYLLGITRGSL